MKQIVAVGDMKVGKDGDVLVTHALGSCLGLIVYDPVARVGGLLHAMLPLSRINPQKAESHPYMFVDRGVPLLFKTVYQMGGQKQRLIVKAAGCGSPLGKNAMFKIGERNYTVLKKLLWKNSILLEAEDVGGTDSRTVHVDIATGRAIIRIKEKRKEL
jgi:chemotaxis protein CheD